MVFIHFHLINSLLLLPIPFAASITFNFPNFTPQNQNRDIVVNGANISDGGIQLTSNTTGSDPTPNAGRAIYVQPLHLWNSTTQGLASFSTNFTFVIDSYGSGTYGEGLTFFLAQNNSVISDGGAMGLPFNSTPNNASNPFVAVEFDTFWDPEWDPPLGRGESMGDHVGIDVSSVSSARSQKWSSNVTGGGVCQAWVRYDSVSNNLTVSFTNFVNNTAVRQDGLVYTVDLKRELTEWVIFGFSGATGANFQRNTVRSWSFESSDLIAPPPPAPSPPPPVPGPDTVVPGPVKAKGKNNKVGLVVGLTVAVIFLVVVVAVVIRRRNKRKKDVVLSKEVDFDVEMDNEFEIGVRPKQYSYVELAESTSDFAEENKLREGGFGGVYRGFLKDSNTYIAIKRVSKSSRQGIEEYTSEIRIISQLRHKNLVQLTGWCQEKGELLLVYDYMENGSLDLHLFEAKSSLTWSTRYKIAKRFGFCFMLVDHEKDSETMMLALKATKESDVFGFGVVALELACGRKPIGCKGKEKQIRLNEWVSELYGADTLIEAVDPHLGSDFDEEEIKRLVIVGLWCVHPHLEQRPSMRQVIQVLNRQASLPVLPSTIPVTSYASRVLSVFGVASIINNLSSSIISKTS
ncbi:hypothetical protein SSX86_006567 [Deinandra increscens subsp. villosa]|uniref:non-specific serine/threonine protein kinase n=1 Tax=Deinandra increscens subsp. villosa TaxID=3103831 RepID=A0AAP0DMZ1_9ASTR